MPCASSNTTFMPIPADRGFCPTSDVSMTIKGGNCNIGTGSCEGVGLRLKREKTKAQVIDIVLYSLGAPTIELEISQAALENCVEQSMRICEEYASQEFFTFAVIQCVAGRSIYELPKDVGIVRSISYRQLPINNSYSTSLGGVIPYGIDGSGMGYDSYGGLNGVQPQYGNMGEWVVSQIYNKSFAATSSGIGGWEFVGGSTSHIKVYPAPCGGCDQIIVHYLQKCKDWEDVNTAIIEGTKWQVMEILARIRGKYLNLPGPSGGLLLDSSSMLQEALEMKREWERRLYERFGGMLHISTG